MKCICDKYRALEIYCDTESVEACTHEGLQSLLSPTYMRHGTNARTAVIKQLTIINKGTGQY